MAYDALTNDETATDKAITQPLMRKIKGNLDFLFSQAQGTPVVINGGFEVDADGDGQPDNWTVTAFSGGTVVLDTTSPMAGAKSLVMTHPGGAGNGGGKCVSDYIECGNTEQVILRCMQKSESSGIENQVVMEYYDKGKVTIGSSLYETLYSSTDNPVVTRTFNMLATPPSAAKFMKVRLVGGTSNVDPSTAVKVWWDSVSLESGLVSEEFTASGNFVAKTEACLLEMCGGGGSGAGGGGGGGGAGAGVTGRYASLTVGEIVSIVIGSGGAGAGAGVAGKDGDATTFTSNAETITAAGGGGGWLAGSGGYGGESGGQGGVGGSINGNYNGGHSGTYAGGSGSTASGGGGGGLYGAGSSGGSTGSIAANTGAGSAAAGGGKASGPAGSGKVVVSYII